MASPTIDRRMGLVGNMAMKAPVTVLAASNITLSGQQTIDGVAVLATNSAGVPDRVLCIGQTNGADNGIWNVSTGAWSRALDANGSYDLGQGSTVLVNRGTNYAGSYWRLTTSGTITIGTTSQTWERALSSAASSMSFVQRGTGAVTRTMQEKARDFISILDFIPEAEHDAIRAGTSTYDCYTAITNAMNSVLSFDAQIYTKAGPEIYFPPGGYYCTQTLHIKVQVHFRGANGGMPDGQPSRIVFPASTAGIVIHAYNTDETGTAAVARTAGGDGTILENITLHGGGGAANQTYSGIWLRGRANLQNVTIRNFAGHCCKVLASAGGGGFVEGNANYFRIIGGRFVTAGLHGIFVDGADANIGTVIGVDVSLNGGWGIYDSSFLGNDYIGCHSADNTLGAYKTDDANARNLFLGCYSEGGQPAASFVYPTMVVGGLHGSGAASPGAPFIDMRDFPTKVAGSATAGTGETITLRAGAVDAADANVQQLDCGDAFPFRFKYETGKWFWNWANTSNKFMRFYNSNATTTGGYGRTFTQGEVGFRRFFLGDDSQVKLQDVGPPPTSTGVTSVVGDVYWNTSPTSGTNAGWICTVAGSPGTFRTFGAITTST